MSAANFFTSFRNKIAMPREISAGAVVFRRDNEEICYLLLHYKSGHWDFPKGHIEKGEDEEMTARREIKEETGISDIKIINGFKEKINYFFRRTYNLSKKKGPAQNSSAENIEAGKKKEIPWTFKLVNFYLAETKDKEIKISYEHIDYKWLLYDDAVKQLTFKTAKEILKKANDFIVKHKTPA